MAGARRNAVVTGPARIFAVLALLVLHLIEFGGIGW